jgi:hypothetical protein
MKKIIYLLLLVCNGLFAQLNTSQCMDTLYHFSGSNGSVKGAVVGDWTGEGYTDVLLADYDAGTVNVWYNASAGAMLPSQLVIPDLPQARSIAAGFFDFGGSTDLAVLITNGGIDSVILFFNDGTGGIMNRIGFQAPGYQQIFVKDLNTDNLQDVVGFDNSNVYVHMNQGPGPFAAVQSFPVPHATIRGLELGDMDNDNKQDIFIASRFVNGNDSSEIVLIRNTTPAFQINPVLLAEVSRYTFTTGLHTGLNALTVADLNGDNNDDVAASLGGSMELATLINTGSNSLGAPDFDLLTVSPTFLRSSEMDNDGDIDLVAMNSNGEILFSHNDGTGHCVAHTVYNSGTIFYDGLATGNLDNATDTRTDVVVYSSLSGQVIPAAIYNRNNFSLSLGINSTIVCGNDSALFTAAVSDPVYASYAGFTDFLWSNGTLNDSAYFNTAQATLSAQFSNTLGCVRSDTSHLDIIAVPTGFNVMSPAVVCDTLLVYLNPPMPNLSCGWNAAYPFADYWQPHPGSDSVYMTKSIVPVPDDYYTLNYTDTVTGCAGTLQVHAYFSGMTLYNQGLVATMCENDTIVLYNYLAADDYFAPSGLVMNWVSPYNNYTGIYAQHYDPVHYVQTFTATVTDPLGCVLTDTVRTQVLGSAKDFVGHITTPASLDVTNGFVYAYKLDSTFTYSDTLARVSIDANGKYVFPLLDNGVYIIKAEPDYASYPDLISTYYGGEFQWYFSQLVAHGCVQVDTADIQVLQADTATGTGSISGFLIEDVGFASGRYGSAGGHDHICVPGGPLKGIDVKLGKNPAGGIQARVMTDSTGHYSFDNVPLQGYKIYVDIPNMLMDSTRELVLSVGSETSIQNNYYVDSTVIYINHDSINPVGIYASAKKYDNQFSIYPNPAKGRMNLRFRLESLKEIKVEITDAVGKKLYSISETPILKGENELGLDAQEIGLKAGVYFVSIVCEGKRSTQRVVVVK